MQISVGTKIALKFAGGAAFTAAGVVCGIFARADAALFAPLLAGLLFGVLGDFLLAAKNVREKRCEKLFFAGGIAAFAAGHIAYIVYFYRLAPHGYLAPLSAAAFAVAYVLVTATVCKFKYGVMLVPVSLYCFVVVYSFAAAVSAAVAGTAGVLVAVGAALFLVSDIVLSVYIFAPVRCRALGILNLAAYFPAQFLLALSILFV